MPCQIQDTYVDINGVALPGLVVTAVPTATPLFESFGGVFKEVQPGILPATTDNSGVWSITLPFPSLCDPSSVQWIVKLPDSTEWIGTVPEGVAGPITLKTLKDSHGWSLLRERPSITVATGPPGPAIAGPQGAQGPTGTPVWKGAWSGATAYVAGDAVSDAGSSYVCKLAHTNFEPPNSTYWTVLAQRGTDGATGPAGTAIDATTTTTGVVEVDHAPSGSHPIALTTDGTSMPASLLGTSASKAAAGNDARLSDARTPTTHATSHEPGSSDELFGLTDAQIAAANKDGVAGTASLRTLGTGAQQATAGNDSRLSNARTPTAHESTHEAGGSDAFPWSTINGSGTDAGKPAAGSTNSGYLYHATDTTKVYKSNGSVWSVVLDASAPGGALTYAPAPSGDVTGAADTTALQAVLAALPATGGTVRLQRGTYYITHLVTTTPVWITGEGMCDSDLVHAPTTVVCVSSTLNAIEVQSKPFIASSFWLRNGAGSTPTAGAGIAFLNTLTGDGARFRELAITGFYVNIDMENGWTWSADACLFDDAVRDSILIRDTGLPDGGNMSLDMCSIHAGPHNRTPRSLVRWESGGCLRVNNSKFGTDDSIGAVTVSGAMLDIAVADGVNTSDMLIVGNSIEDFSGYGARVHLGGGSHTGQLRNILFAANQFYSAAANAIGLGLDPEAAGQIHTVITSGTAFDLQGTGSIAHKLVNIDNVVLGAAVYHGTSLMNISIGSSVTNLVQGIPPASTSVEGAVRVDDNSSGDPVAITEAGYLASITALTNNNLSLAANIALSKLGASGAASGQVPQWNGSNWVPATPTSASRSELVVQDGVTNPPVALTLEDGTDFIYQDV